MNSNSTLHKYAEFIHKWKWTVAITTILLSIGVGYGGSLLWFDSDYHAYFSESNPQLEAFDNLQATYTKDESVIIAITPKDKNLFTPYNLSALKSMTDEAWSIPYNTRVDGLTNFQHTRAVEDDLYVTDLVEETEDLNSNDISYIKDVALNDPLLVHKIVNPQGSVTAINVNIMLPGESDQELPEVMTTVRNLIASWSKKYDGFQFHLTGIIPMNDAFFVAMTKDSMTLIPAMFGIVILLIGIMTRSFSATFATLLVIICSILVAAGFGGFTNIGLTPASVIFPTIILTLAVADSIHILITMISRMRAGMTKTEAISESLKVNYVPITITSLTTIIGFLTMNFGDVPPYWDLGNLTAVGMLGALIFSLSTLPALMHILPFKVKAIEGYNARATIYEKIGLWVSNHPISTLSGTTIVLIALGFFASRNILNDEFVKYFNQSVKFRTDADYISSNLTGMYNMEYSLNSGESGGISNPEYLQNLSNFETWLRDQPEITHVSAFSEVARKVNKSMHGDDPNYYTTPSSREEAAQYLLLYEMSLPFGLDLNNQINVDKSETRVTVTTGNMKSIETMNLNYRIEQWLQDNTPDYMHALGSSTILMFAYLGERQSLSITRGNIIALVLISLILMIVLRNVKLGLLSLIPNVTPIIAGFGLWYFFSGEINVGMIVVFGMTLGIIVDDTVHFLSKYLHAKRELDYNPKEAVVYAFRSVGKALFVTTIVLILGFAVLSQSAFLLNSSIAQIAMMVIGAALFIDFLFLPALLIMIEGKTTDTLRSELIKN